MTRVTFGSHPFLLGFEQLDRLVERTAKAGNDGYPPYNIEQSSPDTYRITLAVAGFSDDDLSITLEDKQLTVRGKQSDAAESPRGSSNAPSFWPTASRCRGRQPRTAFCISI